MDAKVLLYAVANRVTMYLLDNRSKKNYEPLLLF